MELQDNLYDAEEGLELGITEPEAEEEVVRPPMSTCSLILLAIGFGGLQPVFATIFSNGAAYLRSLHVSEPVMALTWVAGPICGATLQPYFGICSEQCRSRWGRRRPFILWGGLIAIVSLLGLAWAEGITAAVWKLGILPEHSFVQITALIAVFFIFTLNVAIQPIQGGLRALVVDVCPREQLELANAWVGRLTSISNVLSYLAAFEDLSRWIPWLGGSQFRILCVLTSITLILSLMLTCLTVREERLRSDIEADKERETVAERLWYLCTAFPRLPRQVRRVCLVQFFSWMGWFPFLYYITLYIGNIYKQRTHGTGHQTSSVIALKRIEDEATRMGSFGLLLFAAVALLAGAVLPPLLSHAQQRDRCHNKEDPRFRTRKSWDMQRIWMLSHVLFALSMLSTFFISSLWGTYILVGLCGVSWAATIWIPFAIISMAITDTTTSEEKCLGTQEIERRPGIVTSLHNVAIAGPQIVAAVCTSLIFCLFDRLKIGGLNDSIGWTLRIAAFSTITAAMLTKSTR